MESIVEANPDVIIIGSSGNKSQAAIEKIKADPSWQSISAVKNNRIYANPTGTSHGIVTAQKKRYKFCGLHNYSTRNALPM